MIFRRLFFSIVFVGMAVCFANCQVGLRLGVNMESLKINSISFGIPFSITLDHKLGGHFGAFYITEIIERFSIRTNLLFTTGGGEGIISAFGRGGSRISVSYIQVPMDFMYALSLGENSMSILSGPFIGYLISSSYPNTSGRADDLNTFEYGVNLGLHFQIKAVGIGVIYGLGLSDIVPEGVLISGFTGDVDAKSQIFSLYFTNNL